MHLIEITYLILSALSVVAMVPQIRQLLITKQSDELSLATWFIWGTYQTTALIYSITLHAIPWLITNLTWVSFYVVMLTLIVKYRKNPANVTTQLLENASLDESFPTESNSTK